MTFDQLANDSNIFQGLLWGLSVGPDVSEDGFVVRSCSARCGRDNLVVFGRTDAKQADRGGAAVAVNFNDLTLTLSRADGAPFDFYSIDLADYYNVASFGTNVVFTFERPTGSTSGSAQVSVPIGLQTFVFDERNVSRVVFHGTGTGGVGQFDNIVLNERPLPEPASVALTLASLGALVVVGRRRRYPTIDPTGGNVLR